MSCSATESVSGTETSSTVAVAPADICQEPDNIPCPRCNSTRTKFCYYNNYKRAQPRYLCSDCCRHFTRGGSLRNVPVGGGSRKNNPNPKRKKNKNNNNNNQLVLHSLSSDPTSSISVSSSSCGSGSYGYEYDDLDILNCSNTSFTSLLTGDFNIDNAVLNCGQDNSCGNVDSSINNNGFATMDTGVTADYYYWPDLAMSTPAHIPTQGLQ